MPSYYCWTKHGEIGVMMEDNEEEEEDDDGYPNFPEYDDTAEGNEDNEVEDQEAPDEPADDDLGRAIADARRECETEKERLAFDKMIEDHNKLLYPTCEDGHKKLGSTLELLQWKAENGVTDSGFGKLLTIIKRKLPRGNELPASTYEAKKIVCPLGLDVQKIHACINDCILYRGEYENLDACPGDEGERPRKRVPAKVMWCKWVNKTGGGVQVDKLYGMTTVDLNNLGYRDEPFVLAKDVAQVFYVKDMSTKPRKRKHKETNTSNDEPGCVPRYLYFFRGGEPGDYDSAGCLGWLNALTAYHNRMLRAKISDLRRAHPGVSITYVDYYDEVLSLITAPARNGFDAGTVLYACCGGGGPYNANLTVKCPDPGAVRCADPSRYVSWDGLHMTEAVYRIMARGMLHGPFANPPIMSACNHTNRQ
ncbi:hypothetical protein QYE76_039295 [Lolium multiflorum]|uniref:DUF4216 domain-containing protein n=1 Tax=Lolium multiflorum TaxID=4521 RepID=A0AAD8TAQ9_LOLMU|nr:hypothetical protein QYE76_039295 [Lolium multiflorum]